MARSGSTSLWARLTPKTRASGAPKSAGRSSRPARTGDSDLRRDHSPDWRRLTSPFALRTHEPRARSMQDRRTASFRSDCGKGSLNVQTIHHSMGAAKPGEPNDQGPAPAGPPPPRWRMWLLPVGRLRRADQQYAEVRRLSDGRLTGVMERQPDRDRRRLSPRTSPR